MKRFLAALGVLILLTEGALGATSEPSRPTPDGGSRREYLIKAAFLYNFAKFTAWPGRAFTADERDFQLCIFGADPFGAALDSLAGKEVRGRKVVIRRVERPAEARDCHLLYVSESEKADLPKLIELLDRRPVLTIADMPEFASAGGMITLKIVDNKIRFEVNLEAARRANLTLSSKILRLSSPSAATIIWDDKNAHSE